MPQRTFPVVLALIASAVVLPIAAQVTVPPPTAAAAVTGTAPAARSAGELLVAQEKYAEALPVLDAEIQASPKNPALHGAKAAALLKLCRYPDARNAALQGLFADPSSKELRFQLGQCAWQLGAVDQAVQQWKPLLADPAWAGTAGAATARALSAVGKEREALDLVLAALAKDPTCPPLLQQALVLDPSVPNGISYLERLSQAEPANREDYRNLGKLYESIGSGVLFDLTLAGKTPAVIPVKEKSEVVQIPALSQNLQGGQDREFASPTRVVLPVSFPGTSARKELMLLDSGADSFMVSPYLVKKLGLSLLSTAEYIGLGYRGALPSNWVVLKELQVGPVTLRNIPAMVIEEKTDFWGETAGIIPLSAFRRFALHYDRRHSKLTLYDSGTPVAQVLQQSSFAVPLLWVGRSPYAQVRINGGPPSFFLMATASSLTLLNAKRAPHYGIVPNVKYGSQGLSGMSGALHTEVASDVALQLGAMKVNLRTVQLGEVVETGTLDCAGILGRGDILDLFEMYLDYGKNTLVFSRYNQ